MAFNLDDVLGHRLVCNHPGADSRATYFLDGKAYCFRPISQLGREDQFCSQPAGYGTAHPGEGACKYHFALQAESLMIRYGKHLKKDLATIYHEYAQDEQHIYDLTPELVLLRTLLTNSLNIFQETRSLKALELATKLLGNVGDAVERIDRIQSRQVLTAAMAKMVFTKALQVATQFIEPERLPAFIELWKADVQSLVTTQTTLPKAEIPTLASILGDEDA